jgi:nicotinamidase-related amidase
MAELVTLRNLMGMAEGPAPLSQSALVMIDCQNTYREGLMALTGVEPAIEEAARLLARAREAGTPIFHILHDAGEGSPYDVRAKIGQISDEVAPRDGEPVLVKTHPNSFYGTDLDKLLSQLPSRDLVLAGFMTHMCVSSTARAAFDLGYRSTVVAAATATRDLPARDGGTVPADAVQQSSLAEVADLFSLVVDRESAVPS